MSKKITVTYSASANIDSYGSNNENIRLEVEIDSFDDYSDTLELLRSKVLEKLNLRQKHDEIKSNYDSR